MQVGLHHFWQLGGQGVQAACQQRRPHPHSPVGGKHPQGEDVQARALGVAADRGCGWGAGQAGWGWCGGGAGAALA